jgi:hypothetical protein
MRFDEIGRDLMGLTEIAEFGSNHAGRSLPDWLEYEAPLSLLRMDDSEANFLGLTPKSNGVNAVENWALTPWKFRG